MPTVLRSDYGCREDYLRAIHEAGGPSPSEVDAGDCDPLIWGTGDFGDLVEAETRADQEARPHIFVRRYRGGRPRRRPKS
jgi:hypothetical protein